MPTGRQSCTATQRVHRWRIVGRPLEIEASCEIYDDYAPQRAEHASLPGHTAVLATEPLQLWARTMEQSSIAPKRGGLTVQSIPAVAKDIYVWIVGPRRSVNYFNCAA